MSTPYDHALVRRLRSIVALSDADAEILNGLPISVKTLGPDQDIVRQGDHPSHICLIVSGFAAMYKITGPGRRQILNFYVAGDVPDMHSLHLATMDSGIGTLTHSTVGFIAHDVIRDLCRRVPSISDAFWKMTLVDASVFREWIVNVGQRDAFVRLGHLLCEIYVRLQVVGRVKDYTCEFPITQQELADATGVSVVHVNRMLQELRGQGLIVLNQRKLKVTDWAALARIADFDPMYLHLTDTAL